MFVEVETQWGELMYVNPDHITSIVFLDTKDPENGKVQINYSDGGFHIVKSSSISKIIESIITS